MKYLNSGQVPARAALKAHQDDYGYYHTPCRDLPLESVEPPLTYAAKAWIGMTVNHGVKNQMEGEYDKVISDFVGDVHAVGWSAYTLDRAIIAWRRMGKEFMPTQGQLALAAKEAGGTPAPRAYDEFMKDLHRAGGIPLAPPKTEEKKTGVEGMTRQELQAFILKLEKGKIAGEYPTASGRMLRFTKHDAMMLEKFKVRLAKMQVSA